MNKTLYLIFICLLLCAGTHLAAQTFDYNRVTDHPRLLMKQGGMIGHPVIIKSLGGKMCAGTQKKAIKNKIKCLIHNIRII